MTDSRPAAPDARQIPHEEHEDHGHSVAAWTGVGVMLLGFLVMSIGVGVLSVWISVIGAVIVVAGAAAWKVLAAMGYGSGTH